MKLIRKNEIKAEVKTSLSVIRFIIKDKQVILGKEYVKLIDHHIMRIVEIIEKF